MTEEQSISEARKEALERFAEWEKRKCPCICFDRHDCVSQRYSANVSEYEPGCECCCHDIWEVEDWVNDYVPVE